MANLETLLEQKVRDYVPSTDKLTKRDIVSAYYASIKKAVDSKLPWDEIASTMKEAGIEISVSTLRSYYYQEVRSRKRKKNLTPGAITTESVPHSSVPLSSTSNVVVAPSSTGGQDPFSRAASTHVVEGEILN